MEIEVLNPQSDVTLVLGKKGSPKTKIRVSSAVLSGVSRVFATMFRWESTSNASPFEIVLDDDNETALTHILRLCHARHEKLPQSPSPLELLQISIVADKYEIFTVLDFAMTIWLQRAGDSTDDHYDRCNLARVAFILRRDADFRKFTSLLVSQYGHAFTDLWDDADDLMPTRTYLFLERARSTAREYLMESIRTMADCPWTCMKHSRQPFNHQAEREVWVELVDGSIYHACVAMTVGGSSGSGLVAEVPTPVSVALAQVVIEWSTFWTHPGLQMCKAPLSTFNRNCAGAFVSIACALIIPLPICVTTLTRLRSAG